MNNLFKFLCVASVSILAFSSCTKTDNSYEEELIRERERVDSTLNAQKNSLKIFAEQNFNNPILDTATGIWWELLAPNENETYEYKLANAGYLYVVPPTVKVIYKAELLSGAQVEGSLTPVEKIIGGGQGFPMAWQFAFYPKKLTYNSKEYPVGGFTAKGLKKGAKIRFVTSSVLAYDNVAKPNIPADSPLYYTIEITEIK